jgi:hypothetical protein
VRKEEEIMEIKAVRIEIPEGCKSFLAGHTLSRQQKPFRNMEMVL